MMESSSATEWLRIACGLLFIPHIVLKLRGQSVDFFRELGLHSPAWGVGIAVTVEIFVAVGLVSGILTRFAASVGVVYLLSVCIALLKVNPGHRWYWRKDGIEYPLFWAAICAIVAMAA